MSSSLRGKKGQIRLHGTIFAWQRRGCRCEICKPLHDKVMEDRRRRQKWFSANLRVLASAQGCSGCDSPVGRLAYHHIDPATKTYKISSMAHKSLESFFDEIAKCTVLCNKCHKTLHWELRRKKHDPADCGWSKLTPSDVQGIRKLVEQGSLNYRQIAELFGVANSTVCDIHTGKTWSHLV